MAPVRSIQNSRAPWQKRAASVPTTATTNPFGAPVVVQRVSIYNWVTQDTGDTKETAYANTFDDWGCHGCDWKFLGASCTCKNENLDQRNCVVLAKQRCCYTKGTNPGRT